MWEGALIRGTRRGRRRVRWFGRALQGLEHLFAAEDGNVPIDFATHEEGGSGNGGDLIEG
jgi:hypothetical protein